MKPSRNPFLSQAFHRFFGIVLAMGATMASASATVLYWDINGATANSGTSGTGGWNGTNTFWNTASTGTGGTPQAGTTSADDLVFSSGTTLASGTITVTGAKDAASITFEESGVYGLSGGAITLYGANSLRFSNGTGANTIANALVLGASTSFTNSDNSLQTISGGVTGAFDLALKAESTGGFTFSTGSINNGGTLTNSGAGTNTVTVSSVIGTSVTQVIQNSVNSSLFLGGTNTFTGSTVIKAGTIRATNTAAFSTGTVTLGDSLVNEAASLIQNASGSNPTISNAIVLASGVSAALTVGTVNSSTVATFSGGVTGSNNLKLSATGGGGLTLSTGAINNAGSVTANSATTGTITVSAQVGANVTDVIQDSAATGILTLSNGTNAFTGSLSVRGGRLYLGATGAASTAAISVGVAGSSTAAGVYTTAGGSAANISNAITFVGGTLGDVTLGHFAASGNNTGGTFSGNITLNGHNLNLSNISAGTGTLTISGSILGTGTLVNVGTSAAGVSLAGSIANTITTVTQNSTTSTLGLNSASNAFSGSLTIRQGRVNVGATGGASTSDILLGVDGVAGPASLYTSGTVTLANNIILGTGVTGGLTLGHSATSAASMTGTITLNGNALNLSNISTGTLTISGTLSGTGSLTNVGTSTGVISISSLLGSSITSVTQNSTSSQLTLTNGSNAFQGSLTIRQGRVNLGSAGAASSGSILLGESGLGAAGVYASSAVTIANSITLTSGVTSALTIGSSLSSGSGTFTGTVTLNGNNLNVATIGNGGLILNSVLSGTGTLTNNGSGSGGVTVNSLLGSDINSVTQNSATSQLTLANVTNSFGSLSILAGTVQGSASSAGATPFGNGTIFLGNTSGSLAATLRLQGSFSSTNNAVVLGGSTGALTISNGNNGTAVSFNGGVTGTNNLRILGSTGAGGTTFATAAINNTGSVTYDATGTGALTVTGGIGSNVTGVTQISSTAAFILASNGTYSGPTNINFGTFHLSGGSSLAGTAVNGAAGTTFLVSGDSLIGSSGSASVNISAGGTLSMVGGSINTLTLHSATPGASVLNLGGATASNLNIELVGSAVDHIVLDSGLLANVGAGGVNVNTTVLGDLVTGSYTLISGSGGLDGGGGFSLNAATGNFSGNTINISSTATAVTLNVVAAAAAPPVLYFNGALDLNLATFTGGNTNNSNFSSTADGLTDAHVAADAGTELHLQATSLPSAVRTITLGRDFAIKSLVVDSNVVNALTLASGAGAYDLTLSEGITVNSGTGGSVTISAPLILNGSQSFTNTTLNATTISGAITGSGNLNLRSNAATTTGTNNLLVLSGGVNHSGSITNSGTGTAGGSSSNNVTISSAIGANVTGITQNSAGTGLILSGSGANTFTGLTTLTSGLLTLSKMAGVRAIGDLLINGGHLNFTADNQIADTASVTVTSGSFNTSAGAVNAGYQSLDETIGSLSVSGTGIFNAGNSDQSTGFFVNGATTFTGGSNAAFYMGSGGVFVTNSLTLTNMSRTASGGSAGNAPSNAQVANGFILYGNNAKVTTIAVGSGGLTLAATTASSNIVLRTGTTAGTTGSRLALDGNVTTTGSFTSSIARDTGGGTAGTTTLDLSYTGTGDVNRVFDVGGGDFNVNVSVVNGASSAAGITKNGAGKMRLNAASSYSGPTNVNAGTLLINGVNSGTGLVTVASAGTLGGTGTVGGATSIAGIHSVGDTANSGIGTQTFSSDLTYTSTSTFTWQLGSETTTGAGTNFDSVTIGGALDVQGGVFKIVVNNLNLDSTFWASNQTWDIFESGTGTGNFNSFQLYNASNVSFSYANYGSFSFAAGNGQLSWSAVPEPTNALAGVLIAAGMLRRRRSGKN